MVSGLARSAKNPNPQTSVTVAWLLSYLSIIDKIVGFHDATRLSYILSYLLTRLRGADTAHTQMGRPTYEAPTREYTHKHTQTQTNTQRGPTKFSIYV